MTFNSCRHKEKTSLRFLQKYLHLGRRRECNVLRVEKWKWRVRVCVLPNRIWSQGASIGKQTLYLEPFVSGLWPWLPSTQCQPSEGHPRGELYAQITVLLLRHILSYEHFYFSSTDVSNKNFINWTELVQWGLTCFMNISSCIFVWKMWGHLEFNNSVMSSLTILTYLISSNTEDSICYLIHQLSELECMECKLTKKSHYTCFLLLGKLFNMCSTKIKLKIKNRER